MDNQQPKINPTINFATKSVFKLFRTIFLVGLGFNGIIFTLIGIVFTAGSIGSLSYSAETNGTVTGISQSVSDGTTYCTLTYEFNADGKQYVGSTSVGTPTSCAYSVGSTIGLKYDPAKPTNSAESSGELGAFMGIAMLIIGIGSLLGVVAGVIISARMAKREDRNNDGLANDDMPATDAQIHIIQNGMRDLGEFWTPRKMSQQEAREIIATIEQKLAEQNKPFTPRA